MPRILADNKPRRYRDHRTQTARRWADGYNDIATRYPPRDGLGRALTAIAADFYMDYVELRSAERTAQKKNSSPIRKTAGLFLATLRVLGGGSGNGHGEKDLAKLIQAAQRGASDKGE
ncbi:MAG: hypothetical protein ACE1Z6_12380 [Candidatus Methylomirabilales bacterium]|nr:hypothetical protein [candidate division NC10 bacterium]MCZ6688850.1 hypothetical protein [Planctomycetota bacterium]